MEQYVGLDVSQEQTSVCVLDGSGRVIWQGRCASLPEALASTIHARAPQAVKIGLEAGPLSSWLWHELQAMGLPVVCLDPRHAKAALAAQANKTDKNDAFGLAQIVRTGWYREVRVKSFASHALRGLLTSRAQLVRTRVDLANQIRGGLKPFGVIVGKGGGQTFADRAGERSAALPSLQPVIEALLQAWRCMSEQIGVLDRLVMATARQDEAVRRLMTVPGVGVVTALAFVGTIGDPSRFRRSSSTGAYLGLTPRRYQSGEVDRSGRISKCGDPLTRTYLFEAAGMLLTRVTRWSALKAWGTRLAKRIGRKKAIVALARKLAVLLHRIWQDGSEFRWSKEAVA
jgi:transposase